jgi:hypothetical protein
VVAEQTVTRNRVFATHAAGALCVIAVLIVLPCGDFQSKPVAV